MIDESTGTTGTTGTTESAKTLIPAPLVRHGIYRHNGVLRIAIMDNTLQDLEGTDTFQVTADEVTLEEAPGTTEWVDRMARARSVLNRRADSAVNDLRQKNEYIETLGQALLEEAERRDWCSEYDDFAREWDLPLRLREFDVTMTVRVSAPDLHAAETLVSEEISLSAYSFNWVTDGPEYSAEAAY